MPSLERAYGVKGAIIAASMAAVAGAVHGVTAAAFDLLAVKIVVGLAGSIVLIIAGVVSARRSTFGAVGTGLVMGCLFFLCRWGAWSLISEVEHAQLTSMAPWRWADALAAAGISSFWRVEALSMFVPALVGCIAGQERPETARDAL